MIEIMKERRLDILGLCETRLKGEGQRVLHHDYKLIYKGMDIVAMLELHLFCRRIWLTGWKVSICAVEESSA